MPSIPDIAVVVPNYNGERWLGGCLDALARQRLQPSEILVVDNGSTDRSLELLRGRAAPVSTLPLGKNTGFAAAVNAGVGATRSPWVALLNTDTVAEPAWLSELASALGRADERVGAAVGLLLRMQDPEVVDNAGDLLSWQGAAEKNGYGEVAARHLRPGEVFSCCAGAALFRRSFLEAAGGFDESFFAYLEDVDLGLRGRMLGYRYLYVPTARVLHHGHGSALPGPRYVRLTTRNRLALFIKNIPGPLLARHALSLLYGQAFFFICNRRPWASLLGYGDVLRALPRLLRQRHDNLRRRRIGSDQLDALLARRMRAPGLWRSLARRVRGG